MRAKRANQACERSELDPEKQERERSELRSELSLRAPPGFHQRNLRVSPSLARLDRFTQDVS